MPEVVDVTEEFVLELRENDDRDWTVLVQSPRVALKPRRKVTDV